MKIKAFMSVLVLLLAGGTLRAQISDDVIGVHDLGPGSKSPTTGLRSDFCGYCHAPHSGIDTGSAPLWNQTLTTQTYTPYTSTTYNQTGNPKPLLGSDSNLCLSCHDGNYASRAMMRNRVYESLPSTYGNRSSVPTLLGDAGTSGGSYLGDHPVGLSAKINCGGSTGWDCSAAEGMVRMTGPNSSRFVSNYGFFIKPGNYNNSPVVVCTTCHEPHMMNAVKIGPGSASGLPPGTYSTMFFLRGPYNPNDTNPMSNQTAQFCRQCHADKSNEMNGSSAGTVF